MLVLASSSPRRKDILRSAGFFFDIIPSDAPELTSAADPRSLVAENAERKAREVFTRRKGDVVIGADTVVVAGNEILGKPHGRADAKRMLSLLSGSVHEVLTGWCVIAPGGKMNGGVSSTRVKFRELTEEDIDAYIATGEPDDKAGAYAIQDRGSLLVESIEGDFYNVVGLPVSEIGAALKKLGVKPEK